jgi:hypothetical protein
MDACILQTSRLTNLQSATIDRLGFLGKPTKSRSPNWHIGCGMVVTEDYNGLDSWELSNA